MVVAVSEMVCRIQVVLLGSLLCMLSISVVSNSLRPHKLQPPRFLCPWNFPGKNTGVGCHFLLQGSFQPRDRTCVSQVSGIAGVFFTPEPLGKHWDHY